MDSQKLSQLDPKLRNAYERVMGTVIPEPQAAPASPTLQRDEPIQTQTPPMPASPMPNPTPTPAPTSPIQPPASEPQPIPTPTPTMPEPPVSEPQPAISPQPEPIPASESTMPSALPAQANNFVRMSSEVPVASAESDLAQAQTIVLKKKRGMMMPILFGVVGLIFIVIYTLFWIKIFNFKLPFMP